MNSLIKNKKAIVFDWDGTLANTMEYKRANFVKLMSSFGPSEKDVENFHREFSGIPRRKLMQKCLESLAGRDLSEAELEQLSDKYTQMNMESSLSASPFADAKMFLEFAKGKFQLFVSSSSDPDELLKVVDNMSLFDCFDEVLGSRPGFGKGREHIAHIKSKYGYEKEDLIFFGDDKKDYELNHAAGVETFLLNRNNSSMNFPTIDSFERLIGG